MLMQKKVEQKKAPASSGTRWGLGQAGPDGGGNWCWWLGMDQKGRDGGRWGGVEVEEIPYLLSRMAWFQVAPCLFTQQQ